MATERYIATVGGAERELELETDDKEPTRTRVKLGDRLLDIDARAMAPGVYSVLVDGQSYRVEIDGQPPDLAVYVRGTEVKVSVIDARRKRLTQVAARTPQVQKDVRSPMPGKVVKVLVTPGAKVEAGAAIFVIEAMKMENELRSPREGTIAEVLVREGQAVESGEELARYA
jgi:biotin carboxyl carrier protein